MTYRIILTQGNNLSVENNVLGLWNCITYNLKVTSKRAYVHKRLKGEPDQILLGKNIIKNLEKHNIMEIGGEFICIYAVLICFEKNTVC